MKTAYALIAILICCATIGCQVKETLKAIEILYYHDTSVKSQPELIDVVSEPSEVKQLYKELTSGAKSSVDITESVLLESNMIVYQLSFEKDSTVTERKHILLLSTPQGDYAQEIDFCKEFYFEEYSKTDNPQIFALANPGNWRKTK